MSSQKAKYGLLRMHRIRVNTKKGVQIENLYDVAIDVESYERFGPFPDPTYEPTIARLRAPEPELPEDPDGWAKLIPEGMNPMDYWNISPPHSPEPSEPEPYEPEKFMFQVDKYDEDLGFDRNDQGEWIPFFRRCLQLSSDMHKFRKEHRRPRVVKARYLLGLAHAPPRPGLPANQLFHDWMEPVMNGEMETPSTSFVPSQSERFATEAEWMRAMEKYYINAQRWLAIRKNERFLVTMALINEDNETRNNWIQREVLQVDKIVDLFSEVLPVRIHSDILAADPSAPLRLRSFSWQKFTTLSPPPGYKQKDHL
ncbi:hypothetical protein AURDEDRAFT_170295, partial [Auricularia subglabra TFB-10046 SS5]